MARPLPAKTCWRVPRRGRAGDLASPPPIFRRGERGPQKTGAHPSAVAPARLQTALAANLVNPRAGADRLLEAIAAGKASARLLQERAVAVRLKKMADLKGRLEQLTRGLPPADQKIQELLQRRRDGYH